MSHQTEERAPQCPYADIYNQANCAIQAGQRHACTLETRIRVVLYDGSEDRLCGDLYLDADPTRPDRPLWVRDLQSDAVIAEYTGTWSHAVAEPSSFELYPEPTGESEAWRIMSLHPYLAGKRDIYLLGAFPVHRPGWWLTLFTDTGSLRLRAVCGPCAVYRPWRTGDHPLEQP